MYTQNKPTKNKVVWSEDLAKRSRPHRVHGPWFQINQHSAGHIFTTYSHQRSEGRKCEMAKDNSTYE